MNQYKVALILSLILIVVVCSGCQKKETASESAMAESETAAQTAQDIAESTSAAVDTTSAGVSESQGASESITVVSKSDSTIAQAEKKKVLDDISNEIDGLIDEVNKDSSSSDQLE